MQVLISHHKNHLVVVRFWGNTKFCYPVSYHIPLDPARECGAIYHRKIKHGSEENGKTETANIALIFGQTNIRR